MQQNILSFIALQDPVFAPRQRTGLQVTLPECIARCRETGRLKAFLLKGKEGDADLPHIYWDSDVAKVMEGMADMLLVLPEEALANQLESMVDLVVSAQQADGYLNTHFTVVEQDQRWSNLGYRHELYCAGHLMEAAVAHFEATGSRKFLDAMCRYADYIGQVFGRGPGQKRGFPGHEEIELALVKLYRATGEKRYLDLASYFIDERGTAPNYFSEVEKSMKPGNLRQVQAQVPVREQREAAGHAVRCAYLTCGMVDVATETGDQELLKAAIRLFDSMTQKRMYITGGIGSTGVGEKFEHDYMLPNDTAYAESCAAIGLALLAKRLLDVTGDGRYAEVLERVLYNNGLSGLGLTGDVFFYANLLEVNDTTFELGANTRKQRQKWFECSCCPTSYCRFLPQLGRFCYELSPGELRVDIPAAANLNGHGMAFEVIGGYPYEGQIAVKVLKACRCRLALRIPAWCDTYAIAVNGDAQTVTLDKGYWICQRDWKAGDRVTVSLDMSAQLIYANPQIPSDAGRVAIQRGPVVYCLESVDNPGVLLHTVRVAEEPAFQLETVSGLPLGTVGLRFQGYCAETPGEQLYSVTKPQMRAVTLHAIPYALWQNRGPSSMQVFLLG